MQLWANYKTFSWQRFQTKEPAHWFDRIKSAVKSALVAKGWTEVSVGPGDVRSLCMRPLRFNKTLDPSYRVLAEARRGGRIGGFGNSPPPLETYTVVTLVVDLFRMQNGEVLSASSIERHGPLRQGDKNTKNLDNKA